MTPIERHVPSPCTAATIRHECTKDKEQNQAKVMTKDTWIYIYPDPRAKAFSFTEVIVLHNSPFYICQTCGQKWNITWEVP